jgi:hypothetical protein
VVISGVGCRDEGVDAEAAMVAAWTQNQGRLVLHSRLGRGGDASANPLDALCANLFRFGKFYIDPKIPHNKVQAVLEGQTVRTISRCADLGGLADYTVG